MAKVNPNVLIIGVSVVAAGGIVYLLYTMLSKGSGVIADSLRGALDNTKGEIDNAKQSISDIVPDSTEIEITGNAITGSGNQSSWSTAERFAGKKVVTNDDGTISTFYANGDETIQGHAGADTTAAGNI